MNDISAVTQEVTAASLTQEKIDLVARTIARGATADELRMFIEQCNRTQLDPFSRQIYAVKRWDSKEMREVMSFQVSIDGLRLMAQRSRKYAGQTPAMWCGKDGKWRDLWTEEGTPFAAKIGVYHKDFVEPIYAVARFDAYKQVKKDGSMTSMWAKMHDVMIAKCAESLALRKAFPQELSGLYTSEETGQTENEAIESKNHGAVPAKAVITCEHCRNGGRTVKVSEENADISRAETGGKVYCPESLTAWRKLQKEKDKWADIDMVDVNSSLPVPRTGNSRRTEQT